MWEYEESLTEILMFVPGSRSPQDGMGANLNKRDDSSMNGIVLGGSGSTAQLPVPAPSAPTRVTAEGCFSAP